MEYTNHKNAKCILNGNCQFQIDRSNVLWSPVQGDLNLDTWYNSTHKDCKWFPFELFDPGTVDDNLLHVHLNDSILGLFEQPGFRTLAIRRRLKFVKIIKSGKTLNCYEFFMDKTCCPIWIRLSSFYFWRYISGQGSLYALKETLVRTWVRSLCVNGLS